MKRLTSTAQINLTFTSSTLPREINTLISRLKNSGVIVQLTSYEVIENREFTLQHALELHKLWIDKCYPLIKDNPNAKDEYSVFKFRIANFERIILSNTNLENNRIYDFKYVDFDSAELSGSSFIGSNLQDTNLRYAKLSEANFQKANLENTILESAILTKADLKSVLNLNKAKLANADLRGVIFDEKANLSDIQWLSVNLQGTDLKGANLKGAILTSAILIETDFRGAENLNTVNFQSAKLQNAKFDPSVDLTRANFILADLRGVNLTGAILSGANLQGADLRGTNLKGANLQNAILSDAIIDQNTLANFGEEKHHSYEVAINGIVAHADKSKNDSAATLQLNPHSTSKMGRNADVVVENLKHAQHLTGVYWLMSATVLINFLLPLFPKTDWKESLDELPILGALIGIPEIFLFGLSLLIPVLLLMIRQCLEKAYEGSKYLQTRDEIYKVGAFAWTLTQYVDPKEHNSSIRRLFWFLRSLMVFCGSIFIILLFHKNFIYPIFLENHIHFPYCCKKGDLINITSIFGYLVVVLHLYAGYHLFKVVEQFQKPLVFDAYKDSPEYKKLP